MAIFKYGVVISFSQGIDNQMKKIAIIGLGYVGLPLAVEFGKNQATIGKSNRKHSARC